MDKIFQNVLRTLMIVTVATAKIFPQTVVLNDGNRIPILGLGTIMQTDRLYEVKPAVIKAIESGYRHIDTAAYYQTEDHIGEAVDNVIKRGIVTREEQWITTKLLPSINTREGVLPSLQESLKRLKLDYVDLFLIHTSENVFDDPAFDYDVLEVWKGMEDVKKLNLTRSIGVSNHKMSDVQNLLDNSEIPPSTIETEVNPTFSNREFVAYCQSKNITVISYAPFGYYVPRPWVENPPQTSFEDPVLKQIAQKYGKMPSQVVLRYLIDRGTITIPKSTNMEHIEINIDVFDFQLTSKEIDSINELNRDIKVYNYDKESFSALVEYYYGLLI